MSAEPDREPLLALDVIDVDILPVVARVSASPTLLFALRRVCKLWRDAVDGIDRTSSVWIELLSAFGVQGRLPPEADKKAAFVMLLCEPRKLLRRCSVHVTTAFEAAAEAVEAASEHHRLRGVSRGGRRRYLSLSLREGMFEDLVGLLGWLMAVGEEAATSWRLLANDVLLRIPLCEPALGLFGVLGPGFMILKVNEHHRMYDEWRTCAPALACRIADRVRGQSEDDKRHALASLESLSRKVGVRLLGSLNNNYARRLSLPTTASVGQAACDLLRTRLHSPPAVL
uniref:F-box domain-containing protein n=1 Tax=Emiliania huxleyi TaxID=2903 RepID=A0A7S3X3E1_EMIHU